MRLNKLNNIRNPWQGDTKKVLCVCSAGLLRSPTAAVVLSQEPYNFNTRAAGCNEEYALIFADEFLVEWADEIVCMEKRHADILKAYYKDKPENMQKALADKIIVLNIPDNYCYRDQGLIERIKGEYDYSQNKNRELPL